MHTRSRLRASLVINPLILTLLTSFLPGYGRAQACAAGSAQELGGNWYCSEVKAIKYQNFPGHGSYNTVTNMDAVTGQCKTQKHSYSGSLSPLDEELSLHIRGPVQLKKMAVYYGGNHEFSPRKRGLHELLIEDHHRRRSDQHARLHHPAHAHRENAKKEEQKRAVGDMVIVTMDGQVVSWKNEYAGPSIGSYHQPTKLRDASADATATSSQAWQSTPSFGLSNAASASQAGGDSSGSTYNSGGDWSRAAYYDAAGQERDGLTFLNHFGGFGGIPGTAAGGPAFGASLSYASPDGQSGAAIPQTLDDVLIEDGFEIVVLSDKPCTGSSCGYTRPGGVAYHGFGGSRKIFLLEFQMPLSGKKGFNGDMPGIWLLNAQIPLTSQYGTNSQCSCWTSGCGEFDLFEVLDHGNFRCKSTLHMAPAGGSSDWFRRPETDTITAAVVFAGGDDGILVKVLDKWQDFGATIDDAVVREWLGDQCSTFDMQT